MLPPPTGECGAAFPLQCPSSKSVCLEHPAGTVSIRADARLVSVVLREPIADDQLRTESWRTLQEALDLYTTQTGHPLVTNSGDREFVTWQRRTGGYELCYVDVSVGVWSMSGALVGGGPPAPPTLAPVHHPALRFYRLSQASDDLFDAYRNAYLSLECLISGESPKRRSESELDWLIRVAKSSFVQAIPGGVDIATAMTEIYKTGRLPLFHAKQSETFYTPQGAEREHILQLLEELTFLLVSFLRHKLGHHAVAGWGSMSQTVYDAKARVSFECDAVALKSRWLRRTVKSTVVVFDTPRRFGNLWAQISVPTPSWLLSVSSMTTKARGENWITLTLPEPLSLRGVSKLVLELNTLERHASSPRRLYAS